jgi:hypothetical protein
MTAQHNTTSKFFLAIFHRKNEQQQLQSQNRHQETQLGAAATEGMSGRMKSGMVRG